jgi:predicted methyltransferase
MRRLTALFALLPLITACDKGEAASAPPTDAPAPAPTSAPATEAPAMTAEAAIAAAIAGSHRKEGNAARDEWRHPAETLAFFGLTPEMTVVELWPGGGWYTEILAPVVRDRGKLIATSFDPNGPADAGRTRYAKQFQEFLASNALYDKVEVVVVDPPAKVAPLAPDGTVDMVLTFRNSHGWIRDGYEDAVYGAAFKALKSGGILGVVQHRGKPGSGDPKKLAESGYVEEKYLTDKITSLGFELVATSPINDNPKDTKDYAEGVWTLPPNFALKDKDRDKYAAIGETDRMTLKFRKP